MAIYPHDHQLWAVIGLYGGQEDNTFFRRKTGANGLERAGFRELQSQDAINLSRNAIHTVHNPRRAFTKAIHIYGGNSLAQPRNEYATESAPEPPTARKPIQHGRRHASLRRRQPTLAGRTTAVKQPHSVRPTPQPPPQQPPRQPR